jgi:hypothetical protein
VAAAKNPEHASGKLNSDEAGMLGRMFRWPAVCLFPALDIARLFALNAHAAADFARSMGTLSPDSSGTSFPSFAMSSMHLFFLIAIVHLVV